MTATTVIMDMSLAYTPITGICSKYGRRLSAMATPPKAPDTIPINVMPIWMVERNFSGSSNCFSTPLADLLPLLTNVSRRALLEETKAISYIAKTPFSTRRSRIMTNSILKCLN